MLALAASMLTVAVSQLVSSAVESCADVDQLTRRLKAGHIQTPDLTQNTMDGFFSKFVCVWKHQRHKITPQIPEKGIFFIIWAV